MEVNRVLCVLCLSKRHVRLEPMDYGHIIQACNCVQNRSWMKTHLKRSSHKILRRCIRGKVTHWGKEEGEPQGCYLSDIGLFFYGHSTWDPPSP